MKSYRDEIEGGNSTKSGTSKTLLGILIILQLLNGAAIGYVYSLTDQGKHSVAVQTTEKSPLSKDEKTDQVLENLGRKLVQIQAHNIEQAMLESRVIRGMNQYQVRQIWGRPTRVQSGNTLQDSFRQGGIFEIWEYENRDPAKYIMFNQDNYVVGDP